MKELVQITQVVGIWSVEALNLSPGSPNLETLDLPGQGLKGLSKTTGPISRREIESSPSPSTKIPLMGCAASGDASEAMAAANFATNPLLDTMNTQDPEIRSYVTQGEQLGESFNDGPATWNEGTNRIQLMGPLTEVATTASCERFPGGCPPATLANNIYLQDTRDWFAWHNNSVNLLFADGSVRNFADLNKDGFLNPGFPVPDNLTQAEYDVIGYKDSTVELPPTAVYSGVMIRKMQKTKDFE